MKNFEVMIFELDGLPKEAWEKMWADKKIHWIGKFKKVTIP